MYYFILNKNDHDHITKIINIHKEVNSELNNWKIAFVPILHILSPNGILIIMIIIIIFISSVKTIEPVF